MPLRTYVERPLVRGMNRDAAGQVLPPGTSRTLENVTSTPRGLFRPPEFIDFLTNVGFEGTPIGIAPAKIAANLTADCLITSQELVVLVGGVGSTIATWGFDEGTARTSGAVVIGSDVNFLTSHIAPDDLFAVGTATPTTRILQVTTSTLTLESSLGTNAMGAYNIQRLLFSRVPDLADWTVVYEDLVVATRQRELVLAKLDETPPRLEPYVTTLPPTGRFDAACVAFFRGRVFAGDITDQTDGRVPNRIRWSSVTNQRDWSFSTAFADLDNSTSPIRRIVPLGPVLVIYFTDAIFIGQPTSDPGLPIAFQQIETGGIGLVGQRALAQVPNAHFFVGQDNIYALTADGISPVGDRIRETSVRTSFERWRSYAKNDQSRSRVLFGIPGPAGTSFTNIWAYDYTTESWSYEVLSQGANLLDAYTPADDLIWATATDTWDQRTGTWLEQAAIGSPSGVSSVVVDRGSVLQRQATDTEDATWSRTSTIETRDFDFDLPDDLKTFVRFAMKVEWIEVPTVDVVWAVEVSVNKGVSYKAIGNLRIRAGRDEGFVNLSAVGSTARFRLVSTTNVKPYYITEFTCKLRSSGQESAVSTQDA